MTRILTNTLTNVFKEFDNKLPELLNSFIISSLKTRGKYTEKFYKNPSDYDKDLLKNQANECTRLIIKAKKKRKKRNISKMTAKSDNPNTIPKTY